MSHFRKRGRVPVVDTTSVAELDFALYGLTEERQERIAKSLKEVPLSIEDEAVGTLHARRFDDVEVIFTIVDVDGTWTITIGAVRPVDPKDPMIVWLKRVEAVATFRGAFGGWL